MGRLCSRLYVRVWPSNNCSRDFSSGSMKRRVLCSAFFLSTGVRRVSAVRYLNAFYHEGVHEGHEGEKRRILPQRRGVRRGFGTQRFDHKAQSKIVEFELRISNFPTFVAFMHFVVSPLFYAIYAVTSRSVPRRWRRTRRSFAVILPLPLLLVGILINLGRG